MPEHEDWKIKWDCTRAEMLEKQGREPRMPSISPGTYMMEALQALGPVRASGMGGIRPVDWPEIVAFAQGTGRVSEPWEIEQLFEMAQEYVAGYRTGCKLFGIEPMEQAGDAQREEI